MHHFLKKEETGLWLIDVQTGLFPLVDRSYEVLERMCFAVDAAKLIQLPLFVTEQYPSGLGATVDALKNRFPKEQQIHPKTTFSGYQDPTVRQEADRLGVQTWILIGIETHICVLQTAKDLLAAGKGVVILNDAVSSRSLFDFSTAIGELRDAGARISSTETVFYELVRDAKAPEFKNMLALVKTHHA